ncbi:MAG: GHKL domain-containing protein [Victivallales bacterium]|nr:GHKL domain-containing protein [Victivallales bacterium]
MLLILLSTLTVLFAVFIVILRTKLIIAKRISASLFKGVSKERNATADILRLSRKVIASQSKEKEFLPYFIKYTVRSLKANGGAILLKGEEDYFFGCSVAGTFPPLKEVSAQIESQLLSREKKHTEFMRGFKTKFTTNDLKKLCGTKGFVFFNQDAPESFPENFTKEAPFSLMAPIKIDDEIYGCIIVTSRGDFDAYSLSPNDGVYLIRLAEIASLCLEVIKAFKQRQEYESQIQVAREEGMTQVSSGIIHNIGNAVTIAKLAVTGLLEKFNVKPDDRPENLILEMIIPRMEKELAQGGLDKFLQDDPQGKEYFAIMKKLLGHVEDNTGESAVLLKSMASKLFHISEIIELQQRFMGELGTENMTNLKKVIESSISIFDESFNKRAYKIEMNLNDKVPEVLVDASMLTQVFINFIKNAIEAMETENDKTKKYGVSIVLKTEKQNDKNYAIIIIKDNGSGITDKVKEKMFLFGFSTKTKNNNSRRGIGLHFCLDCIKKYGGEVKIDTEVGKGTSFTISIPIAEQF